MFNKPSRDRDNSTKILSISDKYLSTKSLLQMNISLPVCLHLMKMLVFLLWVTSVGTVLAGQSPNAGYIDQLSASGSRFSDNILEDAKLDVLGLVEKYGYPIETHEVATEDGYLLTMHRIPYGRYENNQFDPDKPIVLLMHGLMASSADFVLLGPGNAMAYVLAEEGYDVWIGNARGNFYSRRHKNLNPDNRFYQKFWRFSWDEIGNYDLPAFLDHIENVTGNSRLHYIGHSMGCTAYFVLNALRPEYAEKFISFQGFAPGVFFFHNEHSIYQALAPYIRVIEPAAYALGKGEIMRNREFVTWFASRYCYEHSIFAPICQTLIVSGMSDHFNQTMIPVFLGHSPAGASIRQFTHFGQSINEGTFRRYNHGTRTNLKLYGSETPPDYDLTRATAPTHIHYSVYDAAANWTDVEILASKLPNAKLHKINSTSFAHLDFLWGTEVRQILYGPMILLMKEEEVIQDLA